MNPNTPAPQTRSPERDFLARVEAQTLSHMRGHPEVARRVGMAFLSAMRAARDPSDYLRVTPASLADCVARSADTALYPGGSAPTVYLVPQARRRGDAPELQWRITHRGLAALALRAGYSIRAVPVAAEDEIRVSFGEVAHHEADPAAWPESLDDLVGIIVVLSRVADGAAISRAWVPVALIRRRADMSRDGGVWSQWPIEMAQKTAIKWAYARGLIPIESQEWTQAIDEDYTAPPVAIEEVETIEQPRTARAALGLPAVPAPAAVPIAEVIAEVAVPTEPPKPKRTTRVKGPPPTDNADDPFGEYQP